MPANAILLTRPWVQVGLRGRPLPGCPAGPVVMASPSPSGALVVGKAAATCDRKQGPLVMSFRRGRPLPWVIPGPLGDGGPSGSPLPGVTLQIYVPRVMWTSTVFRSLGDTGAPG